MTDHREEGMTEVGQKSASTDEKKGEMIATEGGQDTKVQMLKSSRRKTMTGEDTAAQLTEETEITGGGKKVQARTEATRKGSQALFMLDTGSQWIATMMTDHEERREDPPVHLKRSEDAHETEKKGGSLHHLLEGGSLRRET